MPTDFRLGLPLVVNPLQAVVDYLNSLQYGLFRSATIPVDWTNLAAYNQPENSGYELESAAFLMPDTPAPPIVHALSSPIEWEGNPAESQELVYGWFAYDPEAGQVVLALLYGIEQPFLRVGPFWIEADFSIACTPLA